MPRTVIFGGRVYNNQQFKDHMNSYYYPLSNMQRSVEKLKGSGQIDLKTMQWGQYQPILSPLDQWPGNTGMQWIKSKDEAREGLSTQANTRALSPDEPGVVPETKCDLLDAAVRKCFNSTPPIPMIIDVMEQAKDSASADQHDIHLDWEYGKDRIPTLLRLTMVCPFGS
jgi:hypothetical protein